MQGKSRRRLLGLLLLTLAMSPRPALSQLVEVRVLLDVLRVGYLDDGCVGVFCLATDRTVEAFGTIFGLEGRFEIRDPIVTQPVRTSPPLPRCRLVIRLSNTIVRP